MPKPIKPLITSLFAAVLLFTNLSAFAQYNPYGSNNANTPQPYIYTPPSGFNSSPQTGYSNDGTLYMGGQKIGNPHQILHDAEIPAFMTITANRYTYTNDPAHPNYGQGTLAQMETATTANTPADVLFNRLYLTANNPYPVVPTGTHNNFQTYQGALANAQTAGYKSITADDGKAYAVKTLTAATTQAQNILVRELPNTSQFRAAADPAGGAVGVRVTQNGDAVALANYMSTVTPYNFAAQPNFGVYGSIGGNVNQYGNQANNAWAGAHIGQNGNNGAGDDCWFPASCSKTTGYDFYNANSDYNKQVSYQSSYSQNLQRGSYVFNEKTGEYSYTEFRDSNLGFATKDGAALTALTGINPTSIQVNREYGGLIGYDPNTATFYYSGPIQGSLSGVNPALAPLPAGQVEVGYYHTHANYTQITIKDGKQVYGIVGDPKFDSFKSEEFSPADINYANVRNTVDTPYTGYLGTPGLNYYSYNPTTGVVSNITPTTTTADTSSSTTESTSTTESSSTTSDSSTSTSSTSGGN